MRSPLPAALSAALALAALAASPAAAQGRYDRIARRDAGVTPASGTETFNTDRRFELDTLGAGARGTGTFDANLDPRKVADAVGQYGKEMNALYAVLLNEVRDNPNLRAYLAEVNTYQTDADVLARELRDARSVARYEMQLKDLDSGWNRTSSRLVSIPGLTGTASAAVRSVDAATKRVEQSLNLGGATLDRQALWETTVLLRSAVGHLASTIEFGTAVDRDADRRDLMLRCNQARQQADRMKTIVFQSARPDRAYLIEEYRKFAALMSPVIGKLRTNQDRTLGRDIREVQEQQRQLADLLLIARKMDRDQIGYMVQDLQGDVERFFDNTTLELLRDLPRKDEALASGDAFWSTFTNFTDTMASSQDPADWEYAYRFIDEQWRDFQSIFREINSEQARADLKEIGAGMSALRENLNLSEQFNRREVAQIAARIEANAVSIKQDGEAWLRQSRPAYMNTARADLVDYELKSRAFHEAVINGIPPRDLRRMETDLFEQWKAVYGYIKNADTAERAYLATAARETTPAFRTVQVALAQ